MRLLDAKIYRRLDRKQGCLYKKSNILEKKLESATSFPLNSNIQNLLFRFSTVDRKDKAKINFRDTFCTQKLENSKYQRYA